MKEGDVGTEVVACPDCGQMVRVLYDGGTWVRIAVHLIRGSLCPQTEAKPWRR